jgi:general stress protein YciG
MACIRDFRTGEILRDSLTRREARTIAETYWRDGRRVQITEDPQEQEDIERSGGSSVAVDFRETTEDQGRLKGTSC